MANRADDFDTLAPNRAYDSLVLSGSTLEHLPPGISVRFSLDVHDCVQLRELPAGLRVGSLDVRRCSRLEGLPEGLTASFVDISDCSQISRWPRHGSISVGRLRARNCLGLSDLPDWLGPLSQLDLAGCANIRELREGLFVSSWIDVGGTQITGLPRSLRNVGLHWRGVAIDERIAFEPQEITAREVLAEANAELRRVKLERMGFDRFLKEADPEILDTDRDPGGERRLFRVALGDDEPLVCVSLGCPSTNRRYLLRVPPETKSCRQAIAWTAGFDNPDDYAPLIET